MVPFKRKDKRQSGRIEHAIPVAIFKVELELMLSMVRKNPIQGSVMNISSEGALVKTKVALQKNQLYLMEILSVDAHFSSDDKHLEGFQILCDVARIVSHESGDIVTGVQFKPLDTHTHKELSALIHKKMSRILNRSHSTIT